MTKTETPWHARLALILALLLPLYLMAAALGTKFGIWGWQFGLGKMLFQWGPFVIGSVALIALISLIVCLVKPPRNGWGKALIALAVPAVIVGAVLNLQSKNADIPAIHDVTTAPGNPPAFSEGWMQRRENFGANPLLDYAAPLNQSEMYQGERFGELGEKSLAEINADSYGDLEPLPLGDNSTEQAIQAVLGAMQAMGAIETDTVENGVYGTFETFWFGFKDDVAVRIADGQIDFRSVSRVGISDIGKNASRIRELRAKTAERLR
ncbi:DUF1499 domain-containing protein [Altererythrobacter sp. GH1-8]|uniref:DUF1499 domain-containing protein n=1 Tax=Altererythrobacter sp. GH1-8 TaxID=3349333 RepID=UPI00374C9B0C